MVATAFGTSEEGGPLNWFAQPPASKAAQAPPTIRTRCICISHRSGYATGLLVLSRQ